MPVRVAAIDFLNPAPLMWDFYHAPRAKELAARYTLHLTSPAQCAADLLAGSADLGLIPVAALTADLRVVPGCTIASLHRVRSIQLIVRPGLSLRDVKSVAVDAASRSSAAYTQVIFRHFLGTDPAFEVLPADPVAMLRAHDACLLIGDPALLALEQRKAIESALESETSGACTWHDVAELWTAQTHLPWVAAVWAARPEAFPQQPQWQQLTVDLTHSRDAGLANVPALVEEWAPRIAIPPPTIHTYLTQNIYYQLDDRCLAAIRLFRELAASTGVLPAL